MFILPAEIEIRATETIHIRQTIKYICNLNKIKSDPLDEKIIKYK